MDTPAAAAEAAAWGDGNMAKPNSKDVTYDDIAGVRVTNPDGSSHNITYSAAQQSGLVSGGEDFASTRNRTAYRTAGGGYTTDYTKADFKTGISLDAKTGNVKIDAPSIFFSTQTYKEKIKPVLEAISQNYKLNKDYKYALLNDENDTKTSEDWIKEVEKELSSWVSNTLQNQKVKDQVKADTGLDLTDEQLIKMSSVAIERQDENGQIIQVTDDTVQSLPEVIKNLPAFKNLQGWQNGEVTYKNLMESWNRENTSDEDLLQVFNEVSDYFSRGEFKDADEYAEMVAFSQFIEDKHPETGFWRGAWDGISNLFYNIWAGAAKFDANVLSVAEGAANFAGTAGSSLAAGEWTGEPATGEMNFVKDYLMPELEDQMAKYQTNSMRLNEAAGSIGAVAYELTPLLMQMAVGNALGKAAANGINSAAAKMIASTGEAGLIGAAEGMTAEQVATAAVNGTNFLMRIMSSNQANGLVAAAVSTLKAAQTFTAVVSTTADLAAQIIVDVAVTDSKLARQVVEGNVSNETKEYILEQVALNAGGWAVATGAVKAVKGVGKTDVGRVINASVVPKINRWSAKVGEYTDNLKTILFHSGDANWNATKAERLAAKLEAEAPEGWNRNRLENRIGAAQRRQQNLQIRRVERAARAKVGELPGVTEGATSWADIVANANKIKRESDEYFTAAHALADRIYKGDVAARVTRIKNDVPTLSKALDDYTSQLTKVLRAEDVVSLKRAGRAIEVGEGRMLSQISKESNEYLLGSYRKTLGESVEEVFIKEGKNTTGVRKEIEYYDRVTKEFKERYPKLAAELDKLRALAKQVSAATQDARVYEKVLTQAELDGMRGSEYFRDGYIRTQRVNDWERYQKRGGELNINNIRDDQHLSWGFEGDAPKEFQDVTFVLFDDVNQVAKQSIRKEEIGYLKQLGQKVEVDVSGEKVRQAKDVNATKNIAIKNIQHTTNNVVRDMDQTTFNKVFKYKDAKSAIGTAEANTVSQGAKVARAEVYTPKVTAADRVAFVKGLDVESIDDLVVFDQTSPFATAVETEDDFQEFLKGLDKKTNKYLTEVFDANEGGAFPKVLSKEEQLAQLPTFNERSWKAATGGPIPDWGKDYVKKRGGKRVEDISQIDELKLAIDGIENAPTPTKYTLENLNKMVEENQDLLTDLKREYLLNNKKVLNDDKVTEVISKIKQEQAIFDAQTLYAQNIRDLEKLRDELNLPGMAVDLNQQMDDIIDNIVYTNRADATATKTLKTLDDSEDIVEYATLKSLTDKDNLKMVKDKLESASRKAYNEILTSRNKITKDGKVIKKMTEAQIDKAAGQWAKQTVDWYEERVNQRFGQVVNRLKEAGDDIVDYDDLFGKIEAINREITDAGKAADIVKTYDDMGREEYVRLSPTVASLITTMPTPLRRGMFGEIQQEFVKVFRMGTTGGLVPQSLIRQWFRDSGLAFASGNMTRTMSEVQEQLTKVYGETIADYYEKNMPDLWQTLLTKSDETGESVEKLAISQEMARAKTYAPDELQSNLYRFNRQARVARNQDGIYDKNVLDGIKYKLEDAMSKTEKFNNIRETNRRVWVYNNAYLDALNNGHSVPMARRYAEMIQAEATTNFSRQAYHLANLTNTVPYLGSAINGSKSFWRLMAIDPVGITTRIVGGYLVPMIALTNMSLSDPENKEIYKQIPEYEKDDNLVFVLSGQKISIPIPQEISSLLRPIQSWLETMQGANDHSIEELTANNIAGFFPYELQGFVNVDADRILVEDDFEGVLQNHLLPGFSMLSSQMMPPLVKSGVMVATGYDPYTRKKIDTSYTTTDPITGESLVVDYKSGELAKALGSLFGSWGWGVSAQMAQAVFNNLLGSGNMAIIDGLSEIAASIPTDKGIGSGLTAAAQRLGDNALSPLVIRDYGEQANLAWRRAVAQLYNEKEAILNDKEYQADLKALSQDNLTEDAQNKILSRIKTKKEEFQERVLKAAQNLVSEYGGTLDRNKYASVLSLMTFTNGYSQDPTDPLAKQQNSEQYKLARGKAIETMAEMGFTSPNDNSIFGYYGVDKDTGEIGFQLYSPLAILDFDYSSGLQSDVALANIKAAVNEVKLWDAHESMRKQIDNIYGSKKKLTNNDYAKIEAIQINWNAEVAKTIAPYLSKMTPEAALNNNDVLNYLYPLIEVPNSWEKNNKGRSVTLGDRGNKKKAYYDSWIKSMFSVNDAYKGQY